MRNCYLVPNVVLLWGLMSIFSRICDLTLLPRLAVTKPLPSSFFNYQYPSLKLTPSYLALLIPWPGVSQARLCLCLVINFFVCACVSVYCQSVLPSNQPNKANQHGHFTTRKGQDSPPSEVLPWVQILEKLWEAVGLCPLSSRFRLEPESLRNGERRQGSAHFPAASALMVRKRQRY